MSKSESDFWWGIKAGCIIAVIWIHIFALTNWGENRCGVYIRQLFNFPVAMFVFMSGYFIDTEQVKKSWKAWMKKRLLRILIPYIVISLLYILVSIVIYGNVVNIKGIFASLLLGTSNLQMYFCLMIMQLIIITPFLIRKRSYKKLAFSGFVTFICVVIQYMNVAYGFLPISMGIFGGTWLLFYYIGIYIRERKFLFSYSLKWCIVVCICMMAVMFLETEFMLRSAIFENFSMAQIKFGNYFFVLSFAVLLCKISKHIYIKGVFVRIGKMSFEIYLIHMFFLNILNFCLPQINRFLMFAITLFISYIVCTCWRRLVLKWKM